MKRIVFFDGHCNLCNKSVDLLIFIDRNKKLHYAPLNGKTAEKLKISSSLTTNNLSVIYYRNENQIYSSSDAVIEICSDILPFGSIAKFFKLIPRCIRDRLYLLIAKNRYRLFGKKDSCRLATTEEKHLFLD